MYYAIICGDCVVAYALAAGRKNAAWKARRKGFKRFRVALSTQESCNAWRRLNGTFSVIY